jgi:hypothetical protein
MEHGETLIKYELIVSVLKGSDLQAIEAPSRQRCRLGPSQGTMDEQSAMMIRSVALTRCRRALVRVSPGSRLLENNTPLD